MCCCSTSRPTTSTRRRASRCSTRCAATPGAVVLVTHDPGRRRSARPAAGGAAARRHRGPLVRGVPGSHRAGLTLAQAASQAISVKVPATDVGSYSVCLGIVFKRGGADEESRRRPRDQVAGRVAQRLRGRGQHSQAGRLTGRSYGSIHSMLRESGTTMRSRGGPNHRVAVPLGRTPSQLRRNRCGAPSSPPDPARR